MTLTTLRKLSFNDWAGSALVVLSVVGLIALIANLGFEEELMSLNAALCFMAAGAAFLLQSHKLHHRFQIALGSLILLLVSPNIVEILFNIFSTGTKSFFPISYLHDPCLNNSLAFVLVGLILVLMQDVRTKWVANLLQLLSLAVILVGVLDVVDDFFDLETLLYQLYGYRGLSTFSGIAVLLLGINLYSLIQRTDWCEKYGLNRQDRKITIIGATILLVIAFFGGLIIFASMAQEMEEASKKSLVQMLESRLQLFNNAIDNAVDDAIFNSRRARLNALMDKISAGIGTATELEAIEDIADRVMSLGLVSAITIYDASGKKITQRGKFVTNSEFKVRLRLKQKVTLFWRDGFILNVKIDNIESDKHVASLNIDMPLPKIDTLFTEITGLGKNGSLLLCAAYDNENMICPQTPWQTRTGLRTRYVEGKLSPMARAVDGQTGVMSAIGHSGKEVISAYAPVGSLGLGMMIKIRKAEMYQPIQARFERTLLLLLVSVVIGVTLLRWQIVPLVRQLVNEISERKRAEERLNYMAHYDQLTGLPNRILFNDLLKQAMIEAAAHERLVALMFLDLDRFKTINDTLGHETGDALLKAVAERLRDCLRRGDTVARLSGDEFALVFADMAHIDDASRLAQKILDRFTTPFRIGERDLFITSSIGITLYPFDQDDANTLLKNADAAMYRAKEQGRNNYQFYTSEMNVRALERLSFETNLRQALERDEFILHYQPKVDLVTGNVIGMEALLRWQNPELGLVSPAEFIPLAEETGLIVAIGEWVIRTACKQNKAWQAAGLPSLRISVNLSARQFKEKNLVERVAQALKETGLEARYLELELTESLLQTPETTITPLKELHALGIHLSIDDFGTGYSSLSYLKRFPIDTLKIDRSFVRDITTDADDAAIANAIITMAHSLGMYVVAEGVETGEQLAFLCQRKCDSMQGYYFSKPLPADAFVSLIKEGRRLTPSQRRISAEMKVMSA